MTRGKARNRQKRAAMAKGKYRMNIPRGSSSKTPQAPHKRVSNLKFVASKLDGTSAQTRTHVIHSVVLLGEGFCAEQANSSDSQHRNPEPGVTQNAPDAMLDPAEWQNLQIQQHSPNTGKPDGGNKRSMNGTRGRPQWRSGQWHPRF